ncbi:MAG: hypothetical protein Q7S68_05405 [Deltaproteobacteria bacterium]|nr:hypothetical protein [Deltaproteobacteria bacterium]
MISAGHQPVFLGRPPILGPMQQQRTLFSNRTATTFPSASRGSVSQSSTTTFFLDDSSQAEWQQLTRPTVIFPLTIHSDLDALREVLRERFGAARTVIDSSRDDLADVRVTLNAWGEPESAPPPVAEGYYNSEAMLCAPAQSSEDTVANIKDIDGTLRTAQEIIDKYRGQRVEWSDGIVRVLPNFSDMSGAELLREGLATDFGWFIVPDTLPALLERLAKQQATSLEIHTTGLAIVPDELPEGSGFEASLRDLNDVNMDGLWLSPAELVKRYGGQFVAVVGSDIVGVGIDSISAEADAMRRGFLGEVRILYVF